MTFQGTVQRSKISVMRAMGYSDQEIAQELGIEPATVSYHKDVLKEKTEDSDDFLVNLLNNLEKELPI